MGSLSTEALQIQTNASSFNFVETDDGSRTLRLLGSNGESESMHSLRGAYSETVYIYGTAIEACFQKGFTPRILSLGLGLGYVEILAAALSLKHGVMVEGESFEILPELRAFFANWATGLRDVPPEFQSVYDDILSRAAVTAQVPEADIRRCLRQLISSGRWFLREDLNAETQIAKPFGCLCFDAFSSKTSPDLWTEAFLDRFFTMAAAPGSVLSTYACTGALKRSLRRAQFQLEIRAGFAAKRDSTFALRELPPL